MTSSTPDLLVHAGGIAVLAGQPVEVPGSGDLRVRSGGHPPLEPVVLRIGGRELPLEADADGVVAWVGRGWLGSLAGDVRVAVGEAEVSFAVRPRKLVAEAVVALVADLEATAEGLAHDLGGVSTVGLHRSRERDLASLDQAVGLASSAAAAIRRRPIHRAHEVVRAVANESGTRRPADARWLAMHPDKAVRAAATGRQVGVARERRSDLDTLENRGVLSTYDRIEQAIDAMRAVVAGEIQRLEAARPAREAFLTEFGSLWSERDAPRYEAVLRRAAQIDQLRSEIAATRIRSGLPDLRPRGPRMIRTARVDSEPAYWATFRSFLLAEEAASGRSAPAPAVVGTLDELWEQWCTVAVASELRALLGPPASGVMVEPGWFATLHHGEVARWVGDRRTIRLLYEPEYAYGTGEIRKLHPGRPWRPDLAIEVLWIDGTVDVHVLDAKFRLSERGDAPWEAMQEVWWKYGDSIGDRDRRPVVRSVWILWPGQGLRLVGPTMLDEAWPMERLRGGSIGAWPGRPTDSLRRILLATGFSSQREFSDPYG